MRKENALKYPRFFFLAAAVLVFASVSARAGDLKVIANPSVEASSVSTDDLKSVFLEEKSSLSDGSHVTPVLLKGGSAHEAFVKQYLGKTDDALQTYYRSLVFTGKGSMPKMLGSDDEVVAYVAKTKGAIGYVSAGASAAGVKTLEVN
jgi:ABC-type phosphate transport system substrate-binding protein